MKRIVLEWPLEQRDRLGTGYRYRISGLIPDYRIRTFILMRSSIDLQTLMFEKLWFIKYFQGNAWDWKEVGRKLEE